MEVVASLSQGRTAAAHCGLFTHKSVPVIFEPPCTSYYCITFLLLVCVTLSAQQASLFLFKWEVSGREEHLKSDKAKYVESHLLEFELADPVDAAPDGTAGHTAHRPLSPAVRLTSCCKYTATSL